MHPSSEDVFDSSIRVVECLIFMRQFHLTNTLSSIMKILRHIVSNSMGLLCLSWGAISKFYALREDRAVLGNFCGGILLEIRHALIQKRSHFLLR